MALTEGELKGRHDEQSTVLKEMLKSKDSVLENYKKEHGKLQLFFDELKALIEPVRPVKMRYTKGTIGEKSYHVAMQISDGHMGAVQEADEIEGFGEYNPTISDRRQMDYAVRVLKWVQKKRMAYKVGELSVLCTGDSVSGDIHDELRITNAFPVTMQIIRAADLLAKQILLLAPEFNKINVHYIGADNHGRLTKKPQAKEEGMNNYNYLVGHIASLHLKAQKNVEFNLYPLHEKVVACGSRQYLLAHGHGIKGWMGIPWYSIERKQNREARARMQIIMDSVDNELKMMKAIGFHKFVFGHYHTPINTPQYSCAGSVQGTDAYDHQNGRHADPSQSAWMIHPDKGMGEFDRIDFNLKFS